MWRALSNECSEGRALAWKLIHRSCFQLRKLHMALPNIFLYLQGRKTKADFPEGNLWRNQRQLWVEKSDLEVLGCSPSRFHHVKDRELNYAISAIISAPVTNSQKTFQFIKQ